MQKSKWFISDSDAIDVRHAEFAREAHVCFDSAAERNYCIFVEVAQVHAHVRVQYVQCSRMYRSPTNRVREGSNGVPAPSS